MANAQPTGAKKRLPEMFCANPKSFTQSDTDSEPACKPKEESEAIRKKLKLPWSHRGFDKRQEGAHSCSSRDYEVHVIATASLFL